GKPASRDRLRRKEDSLEAKLKASPKLLERRGGILKRQMRDWDRAARRSGGKIPDPVIVGARVGGREFVVLHVPQNPDRREQHPRRHSPFIEQADTLIG